MDFFGREGPAAVIPDNFFVPGLEELAPGVCMLARELARFRTGDVVGDGVRSLSWSDCRPFKVRTEEADIRRLLLRLTAISASSKARPELGPTAAWGSRSAEARESRAGKGVRLRTWIEEMCRRLI